MQPSTKSALLSAWQAFSPQAARPDKPASSFAEFLQTQAGKQQMTAGAGSVISLPLWVSLMGLSRYIWGQNDDHQWHARNW
ncbi:hypothetical protein WJX77_009586 [Trebouxia sp. C0004]